MTTDLKTQPKELKITSLAFQPASAVGNEKRAVGRLGSNRPRVAAQEWVQSQEEVKRLQSVRVSLSVPASHSRNSQPRNTMSNHRDQSSRNIETSWYQKMSKANISEA